VVVADRTGDPTLLSAVGDLTDRTAVVDTAFPVEKVLERCYPLCRRAFVFRGDDDEVPSTMLIAELRSLTLDPTLQQAGVPMRWLWPGSDTWIDAYPWSANPQPKLLRNLAGQLHFPVRVHSAEHLDAPIRPVNLPCITCGLSIPSMSAGHARGATPGLAGASRTLTAGRPTANTCLRRPAFGR
jgi:hypothetical protein